MTQKTKQQILDEFKATRLAYHQEKQAKDEAAIYIKYKVIPTPEDLLVDNAYIRQWARENLKL